MKKKSPVLLYAFLALFILCALAALLIGTLDTSTIFRDPATFWKRVVRPLLRLTLFISLGLFAAQFIEGMGWTNRMAVMARPFMRWGHLSEKMGAAFTTAFFSGTSALSMLMSFHREGGMSSRELTLAVLMNTFPSYFLHLPTTFFILLPLVGRAGLLYLLITFCAALLRLGTAMISTRYLLPKPGTHYRMGPEERIERKEFVKGIFKKFKSRLTRILLVVLPVYVIVAMVSDMGFFLWLRESLARSINTAFIPVEALSIVVFSLVAEFTSGYAAAGAMLKTGTLNVYQAVFALLLGTIIAAPVRALRHQLPYYAGIFGPGQGLYLMIASQVFRVMSLVITGAIFFLATFHHWN